MTERLFTTYGASTLSGTADSAAANLLALFEAALKAERDEQWAAKCLTLPATHPLYGSTTIVKDRLGIEPTEHVMQERASDWPLLCLHRTAEPETAQRTIHLRTLTQRWNVHLILGPRQGIVSDVKLLPELTEAAKVLDQVIEHGYHPNYLAGALQWYGNSLSDPCAFSSVRTLSWGAGNASFAEKVDATYHALLFVFETVESPIDMSTAYPTVTGLDIRAASVTEEGRLPDVIVANSDHPS